MGYVIENPFLVSDNIIKPRVDGRLLDMSTTISSTLSDGTRYIKNILTINAAQTASSDGIAAIYGRTNWNFGDNSNALLHGVEGVAGSNAADESITLRGGYFRTYVQANADYAGSTARTSIGADISARAGYAGGNAVAPDAGTAFVGARIWMAPYFASDYANINNFHGLWIYNEHTTQAVTNGIKIESAGGGFTNDLFLQQGAVIQDGADYLTILPATGNYTRIGDAGTTSHTFNTNDDLLISGRLETDGTAYFDSYITTSGGLFVGNIGTSSDLSLTVVNEGGGVITSVFTPYVTTNNFVITTNTNKSKFHDHANSTNPTLFIHSVTDPDSNNTQWISFSHDQTNGIIDVGTGTLVINDGIKITKDGEKLVMYEDDVAEANAYMKFTNGTATATAFAPTLNMKGNVAGYPSFWFVADTLNGQDTGTVPIIKFSARVNDGAVSTRPLYSWDNGGATAFKTINADTTETYNSLITKKSSETVLDDGTITLPTGVSGFLDVWEDTEYARCKIGTDGSVALIYNSANVTNADSDTYLCIYDGGSGAIIKNRLGSSKTIRYVYVYS